MKREKERKREKTEKERKSVRERERGGRAVKNELQKSVGVSVGSLWRAKEKKEMGERE